MNREKIIHLGRLFGMDGESATGIVDFFYYFFFSSREGKGVERMPQMLACFV